MTQDWERRLRDWKRSTFNPRTVHERQDVPRDKARQLGYEP